MHYWISFKIIFSFVAFEYVLQYHMGITCSFMGMCVPILKNAKNIWHWECTFLHGKVKCSSRTCPFMGTHVPILGRLSVFSMLPHSLMGTHVPLMGNTKFSHWERVIPHGDMCFVISTQECVFLHVSKHGVYVLPYLPWEFWAIGLY